MLAAAGPMGMALAAQAPAVWLRQYGPGSMALAVWARQYGPGSMGSSSQLQARRYAGLWPQKARHFRGRTK